MKFKTIAINFLVFSYLAL